MPSNMTVHQPRPRVIRPESDGHVPAGRDEHDVPARRVIQPPLAGARGRVEGRGVVADDDDVAAVPVDRVRDGEDAGVVERQVSAVDDHEDVALVCRVCRVCNAGG